MPRLFLFVVLLTLIWPLVAFGASTLEVPLALVLPAGELRVVVALLCSAALLATLALLAARAAPPRPSVLALFSNIRFAAGRLTGEPRVPGDELGPAPSARSYALPLLVLVVLWLLFLSGLALGMSPAPLSLAHESRFAATATLLAVTPPVALVCLSALARAMRRSAHTAERRMAHVATVQPPPEMEAWTRLAETCPPLAADLERRMATRVREAQVLLLARPAAAASLYRAGASLARGYLQLVPAFAELARAADERSVAAEHVLQEDETLRAAIDHGAWAPARLRLAELTREVRALPVVHSSDYPRLVWAAAVLGVGIDADPCELRRARNRLARRWHPDSGGATERMRDVNEAYAILSRHAGQQR